PSLTVFQAFNSLSPSLRLTVRSPKSLSLHDALPIYVKSTVLTGVLRGLVIDSTDVTVGAVKSAVQLVVPVPVPAFVARSCTPLADRESTRLKSGHVGILCAVLRLVLPATSVTACEPV